MSKYLTIAKQIPGYTQFQHGIQHMPDQVVGIDLDLGLIAISRSDPGTNSPAAKVAMEILMDDMQTNIQQLRNQFSRSTKTSPEVSCLLESLYNINEYLYTQVGSQNSARQADATSLTVFQYLNGRMHFILGNEMNCLLFRKKSLRNFRNELLTPPSWLGRKQSYDVKVQSENMSPGDILLISSTADIKVIGENFIRLTLGKFFNNIDMIFDQINTKTGCSNMQEVPDVIICRINKKFGLIQNAAKSLEGLVNKVRQR